METDRGVLKQMKKLRAAFFTEAGTSRGMGHLVRSYCISQEFEKIGFDVSFFLDSDINFSKTFNNIIYFKWKKFNISDFYDVIFIDSYEANLNIYKAISQTCKTPVYIDDFKRLDYPAGVILNFSPNAKNTFYKTKNDNNIYLLGLKYIPIRDEFLHLRRDKKNQIFIMLGGTDVANLSVELAHLLECINIKKIIVSNDKNTMVHLQKYNNVDVLYKPSDTKLIQAMANSSIAISTASMATYELAYLKIPTVIIAVSKNQEIGMHQLIKHKLALGFVSIKNISWKSDIKMKIKHALNHESCEIDNHIDGNGVKNTVNKILELTI